MPPDFDCIVLGAGIAGVTAARDLRQRGLSVLLIEGSERIGGRMYSRRDVVRDPADRDRFVPLEAGAEYIHVTVRKRYRQFWDEITERGFTAAKFPKTTIFKKLFKKQAKEGRNRLFFPEWGETRTTNKALAKDGQMRQAAVLLPLLEAKDLVDPGKDRDVPAGRFVRATAARLGFGERASQIAAYTLSAHTPGLLDDPPADLADGEPSPTDTISVAGILKDEIQDQLLEPAEFRLELEENGHRSVPGYDSLPRRICDQFVAAGGQLEMSRTPELEMKVTRVARADDGSLVVVTRGGRRFSARTAICTFSVGMLDPEAGEGAAIFGDLLTERKRQALQVVRMGAITKFALEFEERVWGPEATEMTVLSNPLGRARTFFSPYPDRPQGPHVLTALMMGKDHLAVRDLDDDAAIQLLLEELQKVFDPAGERWTAASKLVHRDDGAGGRRPVYVRQDWERDEFARGGNSYLEYRPPDGAAIKVTHAREALKDPRSTLPLFWAGEATAPAYDRRYQPLAVHGAYMSGVRAAEDASHYLQELAGDGERFAEYYHKRYLDRGLWKKVRQWWADVIG